MLASSPHRLVQYCSKKLLCSIFVIHPVGSSYSDQTWPQGLKWDLPTSNPTIPRQASLESSEEELEWSDLSFYDLPVTLKVSMLNINFVRCIPLTY